MSKWENWGDHNFFERGRLVGEVNGTEVEMLVCNPYGDTTEYYQFGHIVVDISDAWIAREDVMNSSGSEWRELFLANPDYSKLNREDIVSFALDVVDYYSWDEFGITDYSGRIDWMLVTPATITEELKAYEALDVPETKYDPLD